MAFDSSYPTETMMNEVGKSNPAFSNPAVARCCKAWKKVYRAEFVKDKEFTSQIAKRAGEAYRAAMPPLTSRESCRDFIACVAQGILIGAITEKNGGKLLYAVQVALAAANSEQNPQKSASPRGNFTDSKAKRSRKSEEIQSE